jgi:hypothetical protein
VSEDPGNVARSPTAQRDEGDRSVSKRLLLDTRTPKPNWHQKRASDWTYVRPHFMPPCDTLAHCVLDIFVWTIISPILDLILEYSARMMSDIYPPVFPSISGPVAAPSECVRRHYSSVYLVLRLPNASVCLAERHHTSHPMNIISCLG